MADASATVGVVMLAKLEFAVLAAYTGGGRVAVDNRTGPTVTDLKVLEGSKGPRPTWEVTFSAEESGRTTVGVCMHIIILVSTVAQARLLMM